MTTFPINVVIDPNRSRRGARAIERQLGRLEDKAKRVRSVIGSIIKISAAVTFVGFALAIREAITFEAAMLNVAKTTGIVGEELRKLSNDFRILSERIPTSAKELAGIGTIAGQLGIKGVKNIVTFTETVAKFAAVTELSTTAAAESLAQLSNVFKIPISESKNLGSALNEVSNNTTATAGVLVDFSQRLGAVGKQVGFSGADIIGLSGTLRDLGFQSELAGTAVSRVFVKMITDAEAFSKTLGISVDEFRKNVSEDAIGTLIEWSAALNELPTLELVNELENIGVSGARGTAVVLALSSASEALTRNVATANKAFKEGTSLQKEFEIQAKGVGNRLSVLANIFVNLGRDVGETTTPVINEFIIILTDFARTSGVFEFIELLKFGFIELAKEIKIRSELIKSAFGLITTAINFLVKVGIVFFKVFTLGFNVILSGILLTVRSIDLLALAFDKLQGLLGAGKINEAEIAAGRAAIAATDAELERIRAKIFSNVDDLLNIQEKFDEITKNAQNRAQPKVTGEESKDIAIELEQVTKKSPRELSEPRNLELLRREIDLLKTQDSISRELLETKFQLADPKNNLTLTGSIEATERFSGALEKNLGKHEELLIKLITEKQQLELLRNVYEDITAPVRELNESLEALNILYLQGDINSRQFANAQRLLRIELLETSREALPGIERGLLKIEEELTNFANLAEGQVVGAFRSLQNEMVNFVKTGTFEFKSFFQSIIAGLIEMFVQLTVILPLVQALKGAFGLGGGVGGGGGIGGLFTAGVQSLLGGGLVTPGLAGTNPLGLNLTPQFAHGGQFTVGGQSGTDRNLVKFNATKGEDVTIRTPAQQRAARGKGGDTIINLKMDVGITPTVQAEILNLMPFIKAEVSQAVLDGKRRGGSFGNEFDN